MREDRGDFDHIHITWPDCIVILIIWVGVCFVVYAAKGDVIICVVGLVGCFVLTRRIILKEYLDKISWF